MALDKARLQELIRKAREKQVAALAAAGQAAHEMEAAEAEHHAQKTIVNKLQIVEETLKQHVQFDTTAADFHWNAAQLEGIALAVGSKCFNLIGAAGTGKTTTTKEIVRKLVADGIVKPLEMSTKYLIRGCPGIVLTSFTRRAVRNLRRAVSSDIQQHCVTLHKLLEYGPVFYEVTDPETGLLKNTMRFEPARNSKNPLPSSLTTIILDEASMISVELFKKLLEALPHAATVQFIFIGDLHQLPPVYGQAILGFKLLELPTVELKQIYRQAQNSPIIALAHKVKDGAEIPVTEKQILETPQGRVTIQPWKKPLSDFDAARTMELFLKNLVLTGGYDEEEDIILCPQEVVKNTAFGNNLFNKVIAQTLGDQRKAVIFEIIAGYNKHYYAVGDRLLVGREDAVIKSITKNGRFFGKRPRPASDQLDRDGNYRTKVVETADADDDFDADKYLDSLTLTPDAPEDRKQEASHLITVELLDSGMEETLSTAGEINAAMFAYCLTVHKSQGSEWKRVFFITHQSHIVMWSRELLYTAITRARESLHMIVEPDRRGKSGTLSKAAKSPRIKGNTLAEKAEYFKGKKDAYDDKMKSLEGLEFGEARAGKAIAQPITAPVMKIEPVKVSIPLVKMENFVSAAFKATCEANLRKYWQQATQIWGERIGALPTISYDLQTFKTVGLAQLSKQHIRLNAVWCVLADSEPTIMKEMAEETLVHEICHLVAWNFSRDKGHDSGWRMAMKLMGYPPTVTADFAGMPEWSKGYTSKMLEKQKELAEKHNADTAPDYIHSEGDEV